MDENCEGQGYCSDHDAYDGVPAAPVRAKVAAMGLCIVAVTYLDGYAEEFISTRGTNTSDNHLSFTSLVCDKDTEGHPKWPDNPDAVADCEVIAVLIPLHHVRCIEVKEHKTLGQCVARLIKQAEEEEQEQAEDPMQAILQQLQRAGCQVHAVPSSAQSATLLNPDHEDEQGGCEVTDIRRRLEQLGGADACEDPTQH